MLADALPRYIDVRKLSQQQGQVKGVIALSQLPRLKEFVGQQSVNVEAQLSFFRDEEGRQRVEGSITTKLVVACQRCLQPFAQPVQSSVNLVIVRSDEESRNLPAELDGWQIDDDQVELAHLLEDEILLAMPIVALHEECEMAASIAAQPSSKMQTSSTDNSKVNPFSVLAELKKH